MPAPTQSNQQQKRPDEQPPQGHKDSVTQAHESGEPMESGRQQGRHVDQVDAKAQQSINEQRPQAENGHVAKNQPEGQQGQIGDDYESGRQDAQPGS